MLKKFFVIFVICSLELIGLIYCAKCDEYSVVDVINECTTSYKFPDDFLFGLASSSYQIEGAWNKDGKGPSIWDTFTHDVPSKIIDGTNGDLSGESYELYKDDVQALVNMKAEMYRFSISWSRILPNGDISTVNKFGIDYYHRLIDELLDNNIEPMVTMYHWDLPQKLQDIGGWTNPIIIDYFEQYANILYKEYGSKVQRWITLNEPGMYCDYGYGNGLWAPGIVDTGISDYLCGHHSLISHAKAYHLYKDKYFHIYNGKVGIALQSRFFFPKNNSDINDIEAADRSLEFELGWFAHPIFSSAGGYPKVMIDIINQNSKIEGRPWSRLPVLDKKMTEYIKGTSDFFGLNYYTSRIVENSPIQKDPVPSKLRDENTIETTDINWPRANSEWLYSVPEGFFNLLLKIKEKYDNPQVVITENGWSDSGELNDVGRTNYIKVHLEAILKAMFKENCNVIGYNAWSLIDDFEWNMGYREKFGFHRVDMDDPKKTRIPKKSLEFYTEVIETHQIP